MTNTLTPRFWNHKEILEVKSTLCEERRVVVKKKRKADWIIAAVREDHLGRRRVTEERTSDIPFRGDADLDHPLVFGETANERENEWNVVLRGGNNADCRRRSAHRGSIQLALGAVNDIFVPNENLKQANE